jgi:arginine/lysine/ornithine decarboxylase
MPEKLLKKLKNYVSGSPLPMHMPGHKRKTSRFPWLCDIGGDIDITEIDGFDNLNSPEGIFAKLNARIARLWGADRSFALVNGSTVGILAAVRSAVSDGDGILMARGCHKSVYNAAALCRGKTYYLVPEVNDIGIYGSIKPETVQEELRWHSDIKLVVITSPTYEGVISDIGSIAEICHEHGAALLVDEAHGAHLGFGGFPDGAVKGGADIVVQSLHKTLPSLTQTAILHVNENRVDPDEILRNIAVFQSSSPSYILSSSIDGCVGFMEERGNEEAARWYQTLAEFDSAVPGLNHLKILCHGSDTDTHGFFAFDPSKIVVSTAGADITGAGLMSALRDEYNIELEMASTNFALAMTGMGDDSESLNRLAAALIKIDKKTKSAPIKSPVPFSLPEQKMTIAKAESAKKVPFPIEKSIGKICGEYVWTYPPGAPLIVPGEVIDEGLLLYIGELESHEITVYSTYSGLPEQIFCVDKAIDQSVKLL